MTKRPRRSEPAPPTPLELSRVFQDMDAKRQRLAQRYQRLYQLAYDPIRSSLGERVRGGGDDGGPTAATALDTHRKDEAGDTVLTARGRYRSQAGSMAELIQQANSLLSAADTAYDKAFPKPFKGGLKEVDFDPAYDPDPDAGVTKAERDFSLGKQRDRWSRPKGEWTEEPTGT